MNQSSNLAAVFKMADHTPAPQTEDGYTKIANELLEAITIFPFSSRQLKVILAIFRKTYGFNKKSDDIGLSQLEKMTGIDKAHVSRAINDLVGMHVIVKSNGKFGHNLSINKHYSVWGLPKQQPPQRVAKTATPPVAKTATPPVAKTATTKDNLSKDNLSKEKDLMRNRDCAPSGFDAFWSIWKNKKDKKKAKAVFAKINPNDDLLKTILDAVVAQNGSPEWIEDGGKYIPHPTTWLSGARWEDEVKPAVREFSPEQLAFIENFNANIGEVCQPVKDWSQKISDLITLAAAGKWPSERWTKYWTYVRDKCVFKGQMSFEWLVSRDNLVKVIRGDFEVME